MQFSPNQALSALGNLNVTLNYNSPSLIELHIQNWRKSQQWVPSQNPVMDVLMDITIQEKHFPNIILFVLVYSTDN
jgi:hypothetical protein